MKELWMQMHEELIEELGRDPTPEEVHAAVIDKLGEMADRLKDERKYEQITKHEELPKQGVPDEQRTR